MDIRKIKKLIEMLQESDLREIEVKEGEESVRIARGGSIEHFQVQHPIQMKAESPTPVKSIPVKMLIQLLWKHRLLSNVGTFYRSLLQINLPLLRLVTE